MQKLIDIYVYLCYSVCWAVPRMCVSSVQENKAFTPWSLYMVKVSFPHGHNFYKYIFFITRYTLKPCIFLLKLSLWATWADCVRKYPALKKKINKRNPQIHCFLHCAMKGSVGKKNVNMKYINVLSLICTIELSLQGQNKRLFILLFLTS